MLLRTYTKNHVTDLSILGFHENCASYGAEIKKILLIVFNGLSCKIN